MAVEIQEPNDIPGGSLTPATEDNYEILVYQKSEDAAGIKRMAISGWKDYLGFNSHKVNNVASYVGMPSDYPWNEDSDIPYEGTTVTNQIDTLATKLGISQEPGTFDPLYPRFQTVEDEVNGTGEPASGGLMQRMSQAETDIQSIEEEIGSSGGGSGSLTSRINALETTVGGSTSGLVKGVADINTEIGDDGTSGSIKGRIKVNEDNITSNTTNINTINETLDGDGTNPGLKSQVNTLDNDINDPANGLKKQVEELKSNVYQYQGNITAVTGDNPTTEITVDDTTITVDVDNLKNGWVYNIDPSDPTLDSLTINGEKFNRGENVAIVNNGTTIKFDKLGANIDVKKVNELDTRVTKLESYFETVTVNSSWTSANISAGIYQCSSICTTSSIPMLSTFIISFRDGGIVNTNNQKIDISNNFDSYWEIDSDLLKPKALSGTRKLSIHRIGIGDV